MAIERCSCEEALHLREAMKRILEICLTETNQGPVDDLAEIAAIVEKGTKLEPLPEPWDHDHSGPY